MLYIYSAINHNDTENDIQEKLTHLGENYPYGNAIVLPPYLNIPKVYWHYHNDLEEIFQLNSTILKKSETKIISAVNSSSILKPSSIIGIHVRSSREYASHLDMYGIKPIGSKYFEKAVNYFRKMYNEPFFIVIGDSKVASINSVIKHMQSRKELSILLTYKLVIG